MRVAVLQTDPSYRNLIAEVVKRLGHTVVTFGDGLLLSKALSRSTVDLLILDWNSTGLCGLDLLKSVRSSFGERVPVMFATADGAEHNVVCALTAGADDFVVYPIRPGEFGARVEALLRRAYPTTSSACLEIGPYRFDSRQQTVTVRGRPVQLSGTQFRLAQLFFSNIGRVLSRDHIFAMVWGREFRETTRTIDSHVSRLRLALEIEPVNHFRLQPVYKSGYRLLHLYDDGEDAGDDRVETEHARIAA
ncbi:MULTISPECIES: response regulator transcription factor [unclassified Caballeronia]|jgi:DNA-binding response OmpR family regulator|uniref:response regulator transcription factor n=1 Tax=unclassified Caballeronia TaxID=2646786 RepID=UPI0019D2E6BE|nr:MULTISPECIES: response regulator transcription factor [unclassified Caballeronia]QSN63741.1 response regulator transcription factor [Caballeronia sp. M1242]